MSIVFRKLTECTFVPRTNYHYNQNYFMNKRKITFLQR